MLFPLQEAHPSWKNINENSRIVPTEGNLRHNNNITNSIVRLEQDIHHIAAARQLEVLKRIQEEHLSAQESANDLLLLPNFIDESYIPVCQLEQRNG